MKRIAVVSLVAAVVLLACRADQVATPKPSADIFDAGHNQGNPFFAFLQPLVSRPVTNGVFDPGLTPTVRVDLLSGLCSGTPITYTMSSGPSTDRSETITVNPTDHYHVNLHTDKVPVSSGCTYRIHVLVGATELGYADIALLLNMKEAKNLTTSETLALVDGRTLPIKFWIAAGAMCPTGADCGQGTLFPDRDNTILTQNEEAAVFVPAGAVSSTTTIVIRSIDRRPCFDGLLGKKFQGSAGSINNSCYDFHVDPPLPGGRFNVPVTVGICVDVDALTALQREKIQIMQFDPTPPTIRALQNVPAPFLPCNGPSIGSRKQGVWNGVARWIGSLLSPKPAFARATMLFHVGAGGSTISFSTFTWGLVTDMSKNLGDVQTAFVGDVVGTPPSVLFRDSTGAPVDSVPVTFSVVGDGGSVTGASTLSGPDGVATVGSWRLGSEGTDTLIASAPTGSSVTPTSVMFTATGVLEGAWTAAGSLSGGRRDHVATSLDNGDVLIIGGTGSASTGALIYDHTTGTFSATVGAPLFNHGQGASATKLDDGRVLIAGGNFAPSSAEVYDPSTGAFTATAARDTMPGLAYHSATLLPDGRVLVAGGQVNVPAGVQTVSVATIYDPATNGFTATGSLNTDRAGHDAVLVGGKVLIVGGIHTTTPSFGNCVQSSELYDPATGTFTTIATMTTARCGPRAILLPGRVRVRVLIVGGSGATAELYDAIAGTFTATGSMFVPHSSGTATLLDDGRVLVASGATAGGPVLTNVAEIYDPATGFFTRAARLLTAREEHTATLLPGGAVLVVGGTTGTAEIGSAELYLLLPSSP